MIPTLRSATRTAVVAVVLAAGCSPPDRPPALADPLPPAVDAFLSPDTARVIPIGHGVWYRYLWSPEGPWAIHLAEADLGRCSLALDVEAAEIGPGASGGFATVTRIVADAEGTALVAVNGDFFTPEGRPLGPEVTDDGVRSTRSRPGVAIRSGEDPWIGTVEVEGGRLAGPGWPVGPDAALLLGGFPELIDGGIRSEGLDDAGSAGFAAQRHPRTAIGFDPERGRLWIAVVDGRQGDYSTGMTLLELATLFEALGATEALNLDGGGSSVMVVHGRALSRPSDDAGERPVVNALLLRDDPALCAQRSRASESPTRSSRPGPGS